MYICIYCVCGRPVYITVNVLVLVTTNKCIYGCDYSNLKVSRVFINKSEMVCVCAFKERKGPNIRSTIGRKKIEMKG